MGLVQIAIVHIEGNCDLFLHYLIKYFRPMARRSMGAELAFLKLDTASSQKSSELPIARIPLKDPESSATPNGRKSGDGESAAGSVQSDSKSDHALMPPPMGPLGMSNEPALSPVSEN